MLLDENRLRKTKTFEEYEAHEASLTDAEKSALSRIGIENFTFMMVEYVRLLNNQEDPSVYITDFYEWCEKTMIIYDYNTRCEALKREIDDMTK